MDSRIQEVKENKREYLSLLLLADPDEGMLDRYMEKGRMFLLSEKGRPVCVAVVAGSETPGGQVKVRQDKGDSQRAGAGRNGRQCVDMPMLSRAVGTHNADNESDSRRHVSSRGLRENAERYFFCFTLYCILGWIYEVTLGLLYGWGFENRGFLFGPWLPVYGVGALLLVFLLSPVKEKKQSFGGLPVTPLIVFLLTVLITTILEYITGAALWTIFQRRWWDYSGDFMNLHGFICPRTSLRFGLGGLFFLYVCQPCFERIWGRFTEKAGHLAAGCLAALMLLDFARTMFTIL